MKKQSKTGIVLSKGKATALRKDIEKWKSYLGKIKDTTAQESAKLDEMIEKSKADIDSMSEMGEMESLRLQMAMDRMSKMMSVLSNLLKKISDTQQSILQNIK
ncbi:MAG TPA: hypothetical protein VL098_07895 [Flavipsychrobacter sp.]|nr:hypothetical protein [Flavipsychrobacter sp.]